MVAPVVLLTVGGMLCNGFLSAYSGVSERLREMTRERIEIRTGPDGEVLDVAKVAAAGRERLAEIDHQVPMILRQLQRTRIALLFVYSSITLFALSIIAIAVAVSRESEAFGEAALGLVLAGTVLLLVGLVVAAISLASSADAITYAVDRTRSLGK
jgi:ABC-type transport system involved in cytochrome c biogenesis permease subunit